MLCVNREMNVSVGKPALFCSQIVVSLGSPSQHLPSFSLSFLPLMAAVELLSDLCSDSPHCSPTPERLQPMLCFLKSWMKFYLAFEYFYDEPFWTLNCWTIVEGLQMLFCLTNSPNPKYIHFKMIYRSI